MPVRRELTPLFLQLGCFVLVLGIPDGALGVLWPSMQRTFHLPLDGLGVLAVAGTVLYFLGGLLGEPARRRLRLGNTLVLSCVLAVVMLATWGLAPSWGILVAAVAILGLSRGVIDAVVNAEAALDGGPRRLGVLHGCWGLGGTIGPVLVTGFVAGTGNWRPSLLVTAGLVGAVLVPLAVLDRRRPGALDVLDAAPPPAAAADLAPPSAAAAAGPGRPAAPPPRQDDPEGLPAPVPAPATKPAPAHAPSPRLALTLTIVAFAVYTAAEGGPVAWGYTYLTDARGLGHALAAAGIAAFWAALTAGRFALGWIGSRVHGVALLDLSCAVLVAGTVATWLLPGPATVVGLPIAGLGSAAVFPLLVALTPARVGAAGTGTAVGASIAGAAVGGPAAVALFGVLASHFGTRILAPCFVVAAAAMLGANHVLTSVAGGRDPRPLVTALER